MSAFLCPDIRLELARVLPAWTQGYLSELSGKALPGQTLPTRGRLELLAFAVAWTVLGTVLAALVSLTPEFHPLLPLAWMMFIHGARVLQVQMVHQAAHGTLVGSPERPRKKANERLGTIISVVLVLERFGLYAPGHMRDHHSRRRLSTDLDPTVRYLRDDLGLAPGMSRLRLWMQLVFSLLSPWFYARRAFKRIASHYVGVSLRYAAIALIAQILTIAAIVAIGDWIALVFAVVIPFVLYEISVALRLCVEHEWPSLEPPKSSADASALTRGAFCGARPPRNGGVLGWLVFCMLMVIAVLERWCVLVADVPCHDRHHEEPQDWGWTDAITARQRDLERREAAGRQTYTEVWGLFHAIDRQFIRLAGRHEPPQRAGGALRRAPGALRQRGLRGSGGKDSPGGYRSAGLPHPQRPCQCARLPPLRPEPGARAGAPAGDR